ncbi:MAG TPA: ATPase, T2SS/T4P/T4SS family, partial [Miltoncostaeaceae bacterium]|nr:ATPase, T2SS/T4P/T4SS family [Miltoncostaeaceae bacterium]
VSAPDPRRVPRLGDLLVRMGALTPPELEWALQEQKADGRRLGELLLAHGKVTPEQMAAALAQRLGVLRADLASPDPAVHDLIDPRSQRRYAAVPLRLDADGFLVVAMADPQNILAIDDLRMIAGRDIRPALALPEEVAALLNRQATIEEFVAEVAEESTDEYGYSGEAAVNELRAAGDDAPVVRLVNSVIVRAIEAGASDIHIEPQPSALAVRVRVDGVLREIATVPLNLARGMVSRIKIMAEIDIAERRRPQDGRIGLNLHGRHLDLRVATLPTVHGEAVVIRILDRSNVLLDLGTIGFSPATLAAWQRCYRKPYGALLVTGPTGSGKSTTLYGTLNDINTPDRKIITVEDPVEYRLGGITQIQVNTKAGLTFATGLRSILRSDPDVVMLGEIRDRETAQIAMEAALTGHLLLATLHTNDAASAVTRLTEMGIEPFLSSSAVIGVLAQRLARKVCVRCRQRRAMTRAELADVLGDDDLPAGLPDRIAVPAAPGCDACGGTGYSGRIGVYEILVVSEGLQELMARRAPAEDIRRRARQEGMRTLREDALRKVLGGVTTLDELLRTVA